MKGTMNRTRNVSITLAIVVLLALLFFVRTFPVTAGSKPTLSKKEVRALIASAKT
jgi:autotransporter translocation and assembly factor TamB